MYVTTVYLIFPLPSCFSIEKRFNFNLFRSALTYMFDDLKRAF